MTTFEALYLQEPFWIWLAAGALFVALNLATGSSLLLWPSVAAAVVACVDLMGLRLGMPVEIGMFAGLSALAFVLVYGFSPSTKVMAAGPDPSAGPSKTNFGRPDQTARLIGRIGRTTVAFGNGVGRVWIDGAEWAAELDSGEEDLPIETPVRVMRVIGAVRLQVRSLTAP